MALNQLLFAVAFQIQAMFGPCPIQISDVQFFQEPPQVAYAYYLFASRHVEWLHAYEPQEFVWLSEAEYCKRAWDLLDDCKRVYPNDKPNLLDRLRQLRAHIGWQNYYAGRMPPFCPYWRFRYVP